MERFHAAELAAYWDMADVREPKKKKKAKRNAFYPYYQGANVSLCNVSLKKGRVGCGHEVSAGENIKQASGMISRSQCG